MKFEFSAGGIVYKRQETGNKRQEVYILIAQHSQHHGWVFPKGIIGDHAKGEKKEETAVREVEEETGIKGKIIKPLQPVTYWYNLKGAHSADSVSSGQVKIKKTVYYFLMEYISGDTKDHDFEMEDVEWIPVEEVEEKLTYTSDKQVWSQAKELLNE